MNYLLDTNIVIIYGRDNQYAQEIEKRYNLFGGEHDLYISVVTLGELDAIVKKNKLGDRKVAKLEKILSAIGKIGIDYGEVVSQYGNIDAFSQGKRSVRGKEFTARNMGKNDLWITATASHFDLTLLTTDGDFIHLEESFLELELVVLADLAEGRN